MTMMKRSSENVPCTYCDRDALPGTEPPVCEACMGDGLGKKASAEGPVTLKEVEASDGGAAGSRV